MSHTIAPVLGEATIQELRAAVKGQILSPGDDGYEEACSIWNGAHDGHRPALIVRCTGAADVIAAVGFARSTGLTLAVRGGGHSVAGFSTCDDGIVIDLSPMNGVRVDPSAMRVSVGGGAVWADVDHETQAHGLATTGGLVSSTGVGGFTLGGGIGWTMRKFGLACDNLAAADDVTALVNLTSAPPLPVIPEEWHGKKVAAFVAASAGPVEEGAGLVGKIRQVADPVADLLGPMPYQAIQTLLDPLWPKGIQAYFKATNLARLDDNLIDRLCELHLAAPGPQCELHLHQMGGAIARVDEAATAFAERSMPFVLNAVTGWHDSEHAAAHRDWARAGIAAASDASTGRAYVNFLGDPGTARTSYGEETYARLVSLKDRYDPTNVFHLNQNVPPAG